LFTKPSFSRLENLAEDEMGDTRWTRLRLAYAHHRMLYMNTEAFLQLPLETATPYYMEWPAA
jgi:hypothetical protein